MSHRARIVALTAGIPMKSLAALLRQSRLLGVGAVLSILSTVASGENLLDNPYAGSLIPDGRTKITQVREQNAVTSVRVQRGDSVYHVTPAEQIPYYQEGGRAATWEIIQFRSKPVDDRGVMPPPNR
jgi:hypothetical protein